MPSLRMFFSTFGLRPPVGGTYQQLAIYKPKSCGCHLKSLSLRKMNDMVKQIDLKDWKQIGAGGQGKVYKNIENPDIMLKLSKMTNQQNMQREYDLSRYAATVGLSTPQVYDFVTEGTHYGYTGQLIHGKKSLCRIISDDPTRMDEMVQLFTEQTLKLHSIKADATLLESKIEASAASIADIRFLKPETRQQIIDEMRSIPETGTLLHGDLHFGNLITTGENHYWIDLGRMRYGNPIFDIAQFHFVFTYLPVVCKNIFHLKAAQVREFYEKFIHLYYGLDNEENKRMYLDLEHKATFSFLAGIIKAGPLAVWFIPLLQRHMGLKPYSRWKIIWMLITGHKEIF